MNVWNLTDLKNHPVVYAANIERVAQKFGKQLFTELGEAQYITVLGVNASEKPFNLMDCASNQYTDSLGVMADAMSSIVDVSEHGTDECFEFAHEAWRHWFAHPISILTCYI